MNKTLNKWLPVIIVVVMLLLFMIYLFFITTNKIPETIIIEPNCSELNIEVEQTNDLLINYNTLSEQNTRCIAEKNTINQKYLDQLNKVNTLQFNISNTRPTTCNTCVRQVKELDARLEECYINQTNATIVSNNATLLSMYVNQTTELTNCTNSLEVITTWLNQTLK